MEPPAFGLQLPISTDIIVYKSYIWPHDSLLSVDGPEKQDFISVTTPNNTRSCSLLSLFIHLTNIYGTLIMSGALYLAKSHQALVLRIKT